MLPELRVKVHISCEYGINLTIVLVKLNKSALSYKFYGNKFLIYKSVAILENVVYLVLRK